MFQNPLVEMEKSEQEAAVAGSPARRRWKPQAKLSPRNGSFHQRIDKRRRSLNDDRKLGC
jgi:hypothetical protein